MFRFLFLRCRGVCVKVQKDLSLNKHWIQSVASMCVSKRNPEKKWSDQRHRLHSGDSVLRTERPSWSKTSQCVESVRATTQCQLWTDEDGLVAWIDHNLCCFKQTASFLLTKRIWPRSVKCLQEARRLHACFTYNFMFNNSSLPTSNLKPYLNIYLYYKHV